MNDFFLPKNQIAIVYFNLYAILVLMQI